MQLQINRKNNYQKEFIYEYLPSLIKSKSPKANYLFKKINEEFEIDSLAIITLALHNLSISEVGDSFIIKTDRNLRWNNIDIDSLINLITYGNRTVKGTTIVYDIFKYITDNLTTIYSDWLRNRGEYIWQ